MDPKQPKEAMPLLPQVGLFLGALGIAAGVLGQVIDNSIHHKNPLLIAGSIVFGAGLIADALQTPK